MATNEKNCQKWFLPTGKGGRVEVSEEVYRVYWGKVRADERKKRRSIRCRDGNGFRCKGNCSECPIYINQGPQGTDLSLELLYENGLDFEANIPSAYEVLRKKEIISYLYKVLESLSDIDKAFAKHMINATNYIKVMEDLHLSYPQYRYKKRNLYSLIQKELKDIF